MMSHTHLATPTVPTTHSATPANPNPNHGNKDPVDELATQMDEGLAVKFTEEELRQAKKDFENSLVLKLTGGRGFNRTAFKTVLRELWCPTGDLSFTEIEGNVLIAKFTLRSDLQKVLDKGPWRFREAADMGSNT